MRNKEIFLGINNEGDLVKLELDYNDLNKGTKFYNPHYYLSPHGYTDIKDEKTGEEEARERLEDSEYWEDIGYLSSDNNNPILNHIDFKSLADEVLNNDGWYMTNGEYYEIGEYKEKTYYINLNWVGFEEKAFNRENFKKIYVSEDDFKFLKGIKELKDIKSNEAEIKRLKGIFNKPQGRFQIIKDMLKEAEDK